MCPALLTCRNGAAPLVHSIRSSATPQPYSPVCLQTRPCLVFLCCTAGARRCSCWRGTGSLATLRARLWQRCVHQLSCSPGTVPQHIGAAAPPQPPCPAGLPTPPSLCCPCCRCPRAREAWSAAPRSSSRGTAFRWVGWLPCGQLKVQQTGRLLPGGLVGWCAVAHVWADSKSSRPSYFKGSVWGLLLHVCPSVSSSMLLAMP